MPKQIIIHKEDFPALDGNASGYLVRYRITSEDKNNISAWTPIYLMPVTVNYPSVGAVSVSTQGGITTAAWTRADGLLTYDVWYSFSTTTTPTWEYYGRVNGTSITTAVPASMTKFSIKVFRPSQIPSVTLTSFLIFETNNATV